ncbi:Structural maintenance of chromosomes protein 5 [Gracilariopsis chorda]|uniref:Structural maintenance of chromosomes protein 5 n=1 Tax=Gracilariopsis chorda TaxID=448386 RepID=A0A2V3IF77_9FLOR|nr:Structural maintenance of chromosomes protein 5 [Gracilariopsis chorda]|eukprot:PXF40701.1 Structural maintenance of chromosomes protein 5 [Gracilariopsis chorda]
MVRSASLPGSSPHKPAADGEPSFFASAPPPAPIHPFPGFRRGNLLRVHMHNFLTFSNTTIVPGPRMNLIIGPNGTGKSSVANAVCIVFGGHPRLLGRTSDLGGFVKHGTHHAAVTALIYDHSVPSGVRSVSRRFDTDGNNEYLLDGQRCAHSRIVADVCQRYDIQLDNLSQFMPQEKIAEFVNLQPHELLTITIRSLGGSERATTFEQLKTLDKHILTDQNELNHLQHRLDNLQEQQRANAEEVDAYRQQQAVRNKLQLYRRYMLCAEEDAARDAYAALLRERKHMEANLNDAKHALHHATSAPVNHKKQLLDAAKQTMRAAKEQSKTLAHPLTRCNNNVETNNTQLRSKHAEYRDAEYKAQQLKKAVQLATAKYERARQQREQVGDVNIHLLDEHIRHIDERRNKVRADIAHHHDTNAAFERDRSEAARNIKIANHQLQQIADVRWGRIKHLSRWKRRPLDQVATLVRDLEKRGVFNGHVYGPVGAEIEVSSEYHARIMEHVMTGDFFITAFVTESMRDANVLLEECHRAIRFRPNVFTSPTTPDDEPDAYAVERQVPARPVDDPLRSLGIVDVVSNIYKAPAAVQSALNAQLNLHNVHVGTERSAAHECIDRMKWEDAVAAWYSPNARMQLVGSRYDRSVRNLSMDNSFESITGRFFAESLFAQRQQRQQLINQIREEEGRMEAAREKLRVGMQRIQELEQAKRQIEAERRDKEKRKAEVKRSEDLVKALERQVEQAKTRAANHDVEGVRTTIRSGIGQLENKVVGAIGDMVDVLEQSVKAIGRVDEAAIEVGCAAGELAAEQRKHESSERQIAEMEESYKEKRAEEKVARRDYKRKVEKAKGVITDEDWKEHAKELSELHSIEPSELEERIAELEGQEQGLGTGGDGMIAHFEQRQRKIEALRREMEERQKRYGSKRERLSREKAEFLSWLNKGIAKMRVKFSSLYERLGCAGDLELINAESDKVGDLALQILVSYREDVGLRAISACANSGGEKMCCTMLFCFSLLLEEERMPPFVVVDELNQGLDPNNELKIMSMMFEDAEKEESPQSFVITPKLQLNMPLKTQTKTHIIFNGMVRGKEEILAAGGE